MRAAICTVFGFTLANIGAQTSPCGWAVGEWHQWTNGHYYSVQAITGSNYGWTIARSQARALIAPNGQPVDLATLTSPEENGFVFSGIDCATYWAIDGAGNNQGPNLGGFQRDKNNEPTGSWTLVTGETWAYTNWSPGEPNNFGGNEDFLTFFAQGNARGPTWNDIGGGTGSVVHYYIAESTDERPCIAPPSGMVAWYPGDGSPNDILEGNHGTLQNGVTFATGKVGQAFSFDGVDDQVVVPHNPNQNLGSHITIDSWVYPSSLGHGRTIFQKRSSSNIGGYVFETAGQPFAADNSLQFVIMIGGVYHSLGTGSVLTTNTWQHVAATYDGATMRIFVDGIEVANMPQTGTIDATTDPVVIGRNVVNPSSAWQGMIDEVELFNRALSASEIQAIYNAGSAGKCRSCTPAPANMVGWYSGNGNSNDLSATANNAMPHGGASFGRGKVGEAFDLNGIDAFVQAPVNPAQDPTTAGSLDAWVYLYQTPAQAGHDMSIVVKGGSGTDFNLQVFGDRFFFQIAANVNVASTTVVQPGRWYHVAGTWDSTVGLSIYVDGVLENTNPAQVTRGQSGQPFTIGHDPVFGPRLFNGLIDEAEIFDRALLASEVQEIFSAGGAGKCPPITLKITSISRPRSGPFVSSNLLITGQTEPNLTIRIQSTPNLLTGFSDVGTTTADSNGIFRYNTGNTFSLTRQFYRAVYP